MEHLTAVLKVMEDYNKSRQLKKSTLKLYDTAYRRIEKQLQHSLEEGTELLEAIRQQVDALYKQEKLTIIVFPIYSRMLCYLETGIVYEGYLNHPPAKISLSHDTFTPVFNQYLTHLQSEGYSAYTIESYRNVTTQFLNHLDANGIHDITGITASLVVSFFEVLRCTWVSTNIRIAASAMRKLLWYLGFEESLLQAIPTNCPRHIPIIPMLDAEEDAILASYICNEDGSWRAKAILSLVYYLGVRAVDIINMKLEDIDWIKGILSFVQSKTGNLLILPLLPVIGNCIQRYLLEERPESTLRYVFLAYYAPHHKLTGHSTIYYIVGRVFSTIGIRNSKRKGSHLLRHHAASKQLQSLVPLGTISNMLGHRAIDSTTIYTTVEYEKLKPCCLEPYYKEVTL